MVEIIWVASFVAECNILINRAIVGYMLMQWYARQIRLNLVKKKIINGRHKFETKFQILRDFLRSYSAVKICTLN